MIENKLINLIRAPLSRYLMVNMGGVQFVEHALAKHRVYGERSLEKATSKGNVKDKIKLPSSMAQNRIPNYVRGSEGGLCLAS